MQTRNDPIIRGEVDRSVSEDFDTWEARMFKGQYEKALQDGTVDANTTLQEFIQMDRKRAMREREEELEKRSAAPFNNLPVQYVSHEDDLREYVGGQERKLSIAQYALKVKSKFLKMSIPERKMFLSVLTADPGQRFERLFQLQDAMETEKFDETDLASARALHRSLKSGKNIDKAAAAMALVYQKSGVQHYTKEEINKLLANHPPKPLLSGKKQLSLGPAALPDSKKRGKSKHD